MAMHEQSWVLMFKSEKYLF